VLIISYTKGKSLKPFIPFSKDSKGCINSLFYNMKDKVKEKMKEIFLLIALIQSSF